MKTRFKSIIVLLALAAAAAPAGAPSARNDNGPLVVAALAPSVDVRPATLVQDGAGEPESENWAKLLAGLLGVAAIARRRMSH